MGADVNIVAFRGKFRGLVLPFSCPFTRVAAPLAERGEKERERECVIEFNNKLLQTLRNHSDVHF